MKTIYTYKKLPYSFLMGVVLCLFGVFFSSQAYVCAARRVTGQDLVFI